MGGTATIFRRDTMHHGLAMLAGLALVGGMLAGPAEAAGKKAETAPAAAKAEPRKPLTPAGMLGLEVVTTDNARLGEVIARRIGTTKNDMIIRLDDESSISTLVTDGILERPAGPGASVTTLFGPETVAVSSALLRRDGEADNRLRIESRALTAMR